MPNLPNPIPHPKNVRWGKIVANGIPDYQITARDVCTLAMSSQFEDGSAPQYVIWCYINRKCTNKWKRHPLHRIVQFHSQPINPLWAWPDNWDLASRNGGAWQERAWRRINRYWVRFRRGEQVHQSWRNGFQQRKIDARIRRITQINNLIRGSEQEWARIPTNIKAAVYMILRGEVGNACPRLTDFAAGTVAKIQNWRGRKPQLGSRAGRGNFFIEDPSLPSERFVQVISPNGVSSISKRVLSFPTNGNYETGDFSTEPTMMAAQTEAGENETNNPDSSTSTGSGGSNEIIVATQGVPDSEQTVQRYVHLDRRQLMSHIEDWAQEIEDLLTAFDA